jgi:hypothetical protein
MSQNPNPSTYNPKRLLLLVVLVVALVAGYNLYNNSHFRVAATNPKTSRVAAITPFLNVKFNRTLVEKGISVSITPDALSSYSVKDNVIYINFNNPLEINKKYIVTINNVYDIKGEHLAVKLSFTPKNIPFKDLPKDQQLAIQKQEPQRADQNSGPAFSGMNAFIDRGLTTSQVNSLINTFTKYSPGSQTVDVDAGSLTSGPHDPNSADPFTINFSVNIDSKNYKGTVSYTDLDSVHLVLVDSSGKQVFDSANG